MREKKKPSLVIVIPTGLIAICSFIISFKALSALGESIKISPACLFPACLDGIMVACALVASHAVMHNLDSLRPRICLVIFTLLSIAAQVSYSMRQPDAPIFDRLSWHCWVDLACHGIAPVACFLMVEFMLAHQRHTDTSNQKVERSEKRTREAIEQGRLPSLADVQAAIAKHGTVEKAAKALGKSPSTLYRIKAQAPQQ